MIRTEQELEATLGREESEGLEFKGGAWSSGEECAKDVASLGNALGGQILVGVTEDSATSRAQAFRDWLEGSSESAEQQRIQQWLEHSLRPRDFVDRLTFGWITAPAGSRVLSVEVPPSAESCLAVARDSGGQRKGTRFQFPVRVDKETRFMEYEEVCRRISDPARAMRFRLRELRAGSPAQMWVRFTSPIVLLTSAGPMRLRRDPSVTRDGSLGEETADGITVAFDAQYFWGSGSNPYEKLRNRGLLVPFALVRTMWQDPSGVLCIALDGCVETDGEIIQVSTA